MNRIRLAAASSVAFASALLSWAACKVETLDSHCTPSAANHTQSSHCIYNGNGEYAPSTEAKCAPDGDAGTPAPPTTCPTSAAVLTFLTDEGKGNCTSTACHGSKSDPAAGIFFDTTDLAQFYATLTTVTGTVGTPYVVPGPTAYQDSWIVCNVTSTEGGGYPMPPESGVPNYDDAQVIRDWLLCGAPSFQ